MRISDWSSDVCSSDLAPQGINDGGIARSYLLDLVESYEQRRGCWGDDEAGPISPCQLRSILNALDGLIEQEPVMVVSPQSVWRPTCIFDCLVTQQAHVTRIDAVVRSEEHTSELQSLMRLSYAVFCLKKKR